MDDSIKTAAYGNTVPTLCQCLSAGSAHHTVGRQCDSHNLK